jgi:hypothetical protein
VRRILLLTALAVNLEHSAQQSATCHALDPVSACCLTSSRATDGFFGFRLWHRGLDPRAAAVTVNSQFASYSLATSGTSSPPITPVAGQAVLVMGTVTVGTDCGSPGVGEVTLLRAAAGSFSTAELIWTGLESPGSSPSVITSGASATPGTHILYLDTGHRVDLENGT